MITLEMSKQTAQNLFTLLLYAVPPSSSMWDGISNLFDAMSESDIFSSERPHIDAAQAGFSQIKQWEPVSQGPEDIVIRELSND
jgi:hypothetical protein